MFEVFELHRFDPPPTKHISLSFYKLNIICHHYYYYINKLNDSFYLK